MKRIEIDCCPFCGSTTKTFGDDGNCRFECSNKRCGAAIFFDDGQHISKREAVRRYNRRSGINKIICVLSGAAAALLLVLFAMWLAVGNLLAAEQQARAEQIVSCETNDTKTIRKEAICHSDPIVIEPFVVEPIVEHLYTAADAEALARMAWGECRGVGEIDAGGGIVSADYQKAAAMWCAINRYDAGFEDSIVDVVSAPNQFVGYSAEHPIDDELLALAYDVLDRWECERTGGGDVGRVLPADYLFFIGDGRHNYFAKEWRSADYYTWELPDVYAGM